MSEELIQKHLNKSGLRVGPYEYYNIGNTTLNQLKKYKVVPSKEYGFYGKRKPDGLLVDRRNKNNIKIILVIEGKDESKFQCDTDKKETVEQCNDVCQELDAILGIATDNSSFIWFNPKQASKENEYQDKTTKKSRSYTLVKDVTGNEFIKEFIIDQQTDETDLTKLSTKTHLSLRWAKRVIESISQSNSQIVEDVPIDPTALAKQIWQDVWSVSGATPEKCLYTFVELFIFKYLSDLGILNEDDKGNKINFKDIFQLPPDKAFKNYSHSVRPHLRVMFPADEEDGTTIINDTVLNPDVPEHSQVFYKILKKFDRFGEMKSIDPQFKSRVFEAFMKESISKKNWGQVFTPRNIIGAMIEMSDIDQLEEGSQVCDPACGVGGFVLEPMKVREDGVNFYYRVDGEDIIPRFNFFGFDKGFEKEEQLTIILAKANMLIFLSGLLRENPTLTKKFSALFNRTFKLLSKSILGTLSRIEQDRYDLILTNPPYVTSGSSNYKEAVKNDAGLSKFYKINATGVEGLFLEWIIRSLKPSRKAFVIIPDGILNRLNDNKLRAFIKQECLIDGIISLPVNAFYTSQKKTYILALTKKHGKSEEERKGYKQKDPVFTYLVSNIGETLDVNRFVIPDNDLLEMVSLFNQFKGAKSAFETSGPRCKIQPISRFDPNEHWSVNRWWAKEERVALGIEEEAPVMSLEEFQGKVEDTIKRINEQREALVALANKAESQVSAFREVELADKQYFDLFIGERVLRSQVFNSTGHIPIYSANVFTPFGYLGKTNIEDFTHHYVIWGIDGDFKFNIIKKGIKFGTTDHCGAIKILDESILPEYLVFELELRAHLLGYDRTLRPSLTKMSKVTVRIPVDGNGQFDAAAQASLIEKNKIIRVVKETILAELNDLTSVTVE